MESQNDIKHDRDQLQHETIKQEYVDNYIDTTVGIKPEQRPMTLQYNDMFLASSSYQESVNVKLENTDGACDWMKQEQETLGKEYEDKKAEPMDVKHDPSDEAFDWIKRENTDVKSTDIKLEHSGVTKRNRRYCI